MSRNVKTPVGPEYLPEELLGEVRRIVLSALSSVSATVYLFGSAVQGGFTHASDIDIAVDPGEPLPPGTLARLREALEESRCPYAVDVVDLSTASPAFRDRVLEEGIPWN